MSSIAHVYLNDVEVGSLPAADYKRIVSKAKKDWKLYVLQALILMKVVLKIIVFGARSISAFLFLAITLAVVFFPEQVTETLQQLRNYPIDEIVKGAQNVFIWIWTFTSFFAPALLMVWRRNLFGYYDVFDERISQEIRQILEVPATGNLSVVQYEIVNEQQ